VFKIYYYYYYYYQNVVFLRSHEEIEKKNKYFKCVDYTDRMMYFLAHSTVYCELRDDHDVLTIPTVDLLNWNKQKKILEQCTISGEIDNMFITPEHKNPEDPFLSSLHLAAAGTKKFDGAHFGDGRGAPPQIPLVDLSVARVLEYIGGAVVKSEHGCGMYLCESAMVDVIQNLIVNGSYCLIREASFFFFSLFLFST
jgi:hypothetical protein